MPKSVNNVNNDGIEKRPMVIKRANLFKPKSNQKTYLTIDSGD